MSHLCYFKDVQKTSPGLCARVRVHSPPLSEINEVRMSTPHLLEDEESVMLTLCLAFSIYGYLKCLLLARGTET